MKWEAVGFNVRSFFLDSLGKLLVLSAVGVMFVRQQTSE